MTTEQENELICAKLLGWTRVDQVLHPEPFKWITTTLDESGNNFIRAVSAPTFSTWADFAPVMDKLKGEASITIHRSRSGVTTVAIEGLKSSGAGFAREGDIVSALRQAVIEYAR